MNELKAGFGEADFQLVGLTAPRHADQAQAFVEDHKLTWPNGIDLERKTAASLLDGRNGFYLIDRQGNLRVANLAEEDLHKVQPAIGCNR